MITSDFTVARYEEQRIPKKGITVTKSGGKLTRKIFNDWLKNFALHLSGPRHFLSAISAKQNVLMEEKSVAEEILFPFSIYS